MIPLKAVFVISVLISGLIFTPSYSFAQSPQNDNPLASFFEAFMKLFSFDSEPSEPVTEFRTAVVVDSSSSTPVADAGGNQTVMQFDKVTLDGSSSTDPDGDPLSFNWTQIDGPLVVLSNSTVESPMFNATLDGVLEFLLTVVDTSNLTDTDSVTITVNEKDDDPDNDGNSPPEADAGDDQTVMQFDKVTLDGSSSTDPDGDPLSFNWTQIDGPLVVLSNSTAESPMFNATLDGVLEFLLTVVDTSNLTDTDSVTITVNEKDDSAEPTEPPTDGDGKEKVTICHIPPGNPDNAHTITIGAPAVEAHLNHGDTLGECKEEKHDDDYNEEKQQRESDRESEKQQRESDRESEKQQRESDRESEKQQRESDRESEKQQRESDRESEKQQRESDRESEKQQRESDRESEKQQRESDREEEELEYEDDEDEDEDED